MLARVIHGGRNEKPLCKKKVEYDEIDIVGPVNSYVIERKERWRMEVAMSRVGISRVS